MKINQNLFDLTPEQIETSKMMYSGKVIKCLVAPYHSYQELEKTVSFTKTTYLFPEREASVPQLRNLISMIVANPSTDEFRIITTNQNIIMDMGIFRRQNNTRFRQCGIPQRQVVAHCALK